MEIDSEIFKNYITTTKFKKSDGSTGNISYSDSDHKNLWDKVHIVAYV